MPARGINPDLQSERKKCSFSTVEFTNWWHGSAENVEKKRKLEKYFLEDPEKKDETPLYYLSHQEQYEECMRNIFVAMGKMRKWNEEGNDKITYGNLLDKMYDGINPHGNPFGLNFSMFESAIDGQGTEEQRKKWLPLVRDMTVVGTYAQTELGHGTFVRGLETTATYEPKTQEFVINSPSLSSYKWWPGGLGHTANHCIVIAQLITQGKPRGIFPFIVPLRDTITHRPLNGVTVGDIGPKFGFNTVNQGFLGLKNVRIPRLNMLMRFSHVHEDGSFEQKEANVLTYGTMTLIRVHLVSGLSEVLAKATTIAVRYSAVRKQSQINPKEPEVQIMDHLTQQHKLFPQLAKSIIYKLVAQNIKDLYDNVMMELNEGKLERLPEMHALTCCLKAVVTTDATMGVEACRLACGGHGYMTSTYLHSMYAFATAARTYEGENTVLLLQTARFLIKSWGDVLKKKPLTPMVSYLSRVQNGGRPRFQKDIPGIVDAFQFAAGKLIQIAFENIEARKRRGMTNEETVIGTSIELVKAAEMHCRAFLIQSSYLSIEKQVKTLSPDLQKILWDIIELYTVDDALQNLDVLLRFVNISNEDVSNLQDRLEAVLGRIRPNAVGIVDSFDYPDSVLNSTLGAYDGNVYERLFEEAMKSPLNQEPVNKSFELYLKPLMKKSKI